MSLVPPGPPGPPGPPRPPAGLQWLLNPCAFRPSGLPELTLHQSVRMQLPTILAALSSILMHLSASLPRNRALMPCYAHQCRAFERPHTPSHAPIVLSSILIAYKAPLCIDLAHIIGRRQVQNAGSSNTPKPVRSQSGRLVSITCISNARPGSNVPTGRPRASAPPVVASQNDSTIDTRMPSPNPPRSSGGSIAFTPVSRRRETRTAWRIFSYVLGL